MAKVAMIGLGRMGAAMARRFHDAGHDLIVWNRDRTKAEGMAADIGATIADNPADAARQAEFVVSSLADDAALRAVYLDVEGVARGIDGNTIAIDTSTVDPSTIIEIGEAIGSSGGRFIDCPVSGSVSTVESGALTIMAGGVPDLVTEVEPILSAIAQKVVRVGDLGAVAPRRPAVEEGAIEPGGAGPHSASPATSARPPVAARHRPRACRDRFATHDPVRDADGVRVRPRDSRPRRLRRPAAPHPVVPPCARRDPGGVPQQRSRRGVLSRRTLPA